MTMVSARFRLAILLGAGMAPFAALTKARAAEFEFRLGHPLTTADAAHTAMTALADGLKKRSGGRIDVTVFPADQLGAQADIGEMVRQGAAVIQLTDAQFLGKYVADAAVLQAPYLMDDPAEFKKLIGSAWLNDLNKRLAAKGFRVISWSNFGTRQIMSKKPIHEPKTWRTSMSAAAPRPCMSRWSRRWGARPITTAFAEVYTGLAQGTLDLLEAPLPTMWASKFYEQAKYVSLTAHMIGWDPVVMSETVYQAMPPDLQKIILEEAANAADVMTRLKTEEERNIIPKYKAAGVTIVDDVNKDAFRRATAPVYDRYPGFTPGIKATVQGLLTK